MPFTSEYVQSHYGLIDEPTGRRYRLVSMRSPNPRPNLMYEWKGYRPHRNGWAYSKETMAELDAKGLIVYPKKSDGQLNSKRFLDDDGMPASALWTDIAAVNSQAAERLGFPTQKPTALVERIITASCPPGGIVLDCFAGSGTTTEAAERLGRRWIGIDNSKYAVHLARKRLIQLQGEARDAERPQFDYIECEHCKNIERKEKPQRSPGKFDVQPFTLENMGVYQRAELWQGFQTNRSEYRDEMVRVFGGVPVTVSPLLHGEKGQTWIHVGPLDSAVVVSQVWGVAREAAKTDRKSVTILAADFNTLTDDDSRAIADKLGVRVTVRIIPASAINEIRLRIEARRENPDVPYTSTTIPAFYAPLAIVLHGEASGRLAKLSLVRCEVDIESFLESQRPILKPIKEGMTEPARRKAQAEVDRWEKRRNDLNKWLAKTDSWQRFVDFWAVDWDYGRRQGTDGKPIFQTDWQSFRIRRSKKEVEPLAFTAEREYAEAGKYRVAARVTDVFGNDGIATVEIDVG